MSAKTSLPQRRVHVMVYDEDWEFLVAKFGPASSDRPLGVSAAVRDYLHKLVQVLRRKEHEVVMASVAGPEVKVEGPDGL